MAKQYAVIHIEKGKGVGGGVGNHIDRTLGKEHTFPHADATRLHLNVDFTSDKHRYKTVPEAIASRIHEGYTGTRKIRNDSVKFLSTVLTGTHEQMEEIFKDEKLYIKWIEENKKFMEERFGTDNIIRFTLHMDEKTPHIHCLHVPLTKDGRLSAKDVMGDRDDLKELQDSYSLRMEKFNLERGESRKGVYHETAQEYYRRINITEEIVENLRVEGFFGIKKDETIENLEKSLKSLFMQLNSAERESLREKKTREAVQKRLNEEEKINTTKTEKIKEMKKFLIEILKDPAVYKESAYKYAESIKEDNLRKNERNHSRKNRGRKM